MEGSDQYYSFANDTDQFANHTDQFANNTDHDNQPNDTDQTSDCDFVFDDFIYPIDADTFESLFISPEDAVFQNYDFVPAWLIILLLVIGITGNLISVFVYTRPMMRSSVSVLLASLELINLIVFASFVPNLLQHFVKGFHISLANVICSLANNFLETAAICCSNWVMVTVGLWRYVAINWPLAVDRYCGRNKTILVVIVLAFFSCLVSFPGALLHSYSSSGWNVTTNESYSIQYVYNYANTKIYCDNLNLLAISDGLIILTTVIPCLFLALVTSLLLLSLWTADRKRRELTRGNGTVSQSNQGIPYNRNESKRETKVTVFLTLLVFLYFLAYLPDTVVNIKIMTDERGTKPWENTVFYKINKTRIFILLCNSVTFFIYCAMSERFREVLYKYCRPKKFRKDLVKKSSTTTTSHSVSVKIPSSKNLADTKF